MSKPVSYDELFPGRFLKAALFKGKDATLEISEVETESFEQGKDKQGNPKPDKVQGVISFKGKDKQLALNSTNAQCIRAMVEEFSDEETAKNPQNWIGHRFTFFPTTTPMYNNEKKRMEQVDCIRLKGSPELERPLTVEIKLPRKNPFNMKMEVTK